MAKTHEHHHGCFDTRDTTKLICPWANTIPLVESGKQRTGRKHWVVEFSQGYSKSRSKRMTLTRTVEAPSADEAKRAAMKDNETWGNIFERVWPYNRETCNRFGLTYEENPNWRVPNAGRTK